MQKWKRGWRLTPEWLTPTELLVLGTTYVVETVIAGLGMGVLAAKGRPWHVAFVFVVYAAAMTWLTFLLWQSRRDYYKRVLRALGDDGPTVAYHAVRGVRVVRRKQIVR